MTGSRTSARLTRLTWARMSAEAGLLLPRLATVRRLVESVFPEPSRRPEFAGRIGAATASLDHNLDCKPPRAMPKSASAEGEGVGSSTKIPKYGFPIIGPLHEDQGTPLGEEGAA